VGTGDFFPGLKYSGREAKQSLSFSVEIQNQWICTYTMLTWRHGAYEDSFDLALYLSTMAMYVRNRSFVVELYWQGNKSYSEKNQSQRPIFYPKSHMQGGANGAASPGFRISIKKLFLRSINFKLLNQIKQD
jgi:hypothetical protein